MTPPDPDRSASEAPDRGRSVCVFCGARDGGDPAYAAAAERLGAGVAKLGARLVYGAGDQGLMGRVSAAARAAGGDTFGVIPRGLWEREVRRRPLPQDVVVENLHQRKAVMLANSDAVVALPGGIGTLDELVEALTWRQLGLHRKPILALDVAGYWAPFHALLAHMAAQGFLHGPLETHLEIVDGPDAALARLAALL